MPEADMEPQPGPRSKSGKPTRRGPMDEMRQLVRILVKASTPLPGWQPFLTAAIHICRHLP